MQLELIRKVASGSAASAWLARERGRAPIVLQAIRSDAGFTSRDDFCLREAEESALEREHPNLLSARQLRTLPGGLRVFCTEPVSGRTAACFLEAHGAVPIATALAWVARLCSALAYLHQRHLVHGNLNPKHVHLSGDGETPDAKLLDTGLLHHRGFRSIPVAGEVVEPEYLAPERVLGQRGNHSSDIYGVGLLLFELLTGSPCIRRVSRRATRGAHLDAEVPELLGPLEPANELVHRCLEKDPLRRFPSALDVQRAAEAALDQVR